MEFREGGGWSGLAHLTSFTNHRVGGKVRMRNFANSPFALSRLISRSVTCVARWMSRASALRSSATAESSSAISGVPLLTSRSPQTIPHRLRRCLRAVRRRPQPTPAGDPCVRPAVPLRRLQLLASSRRSKEPRNPAGPDKTDRQGRSLKPFVARHRPRHARACCRRSQPGARTNAREQLFLLRKHLQSDFAHSFLHPLYVCYFHEIIFIYWYKVMIIR